MGMNRHTEYLAEAKITQRITKADNYVAESDKVVVGMAISVSWNDTCSTTMALQINGRNLKRGSPKNRGFHVNKWVFWVPC